LSYLKQFINIEVKNEKNDSQHIVGT